MKAHTRKPSKTRRLTRIRPAEVKTELQICVRPMHISDQKALLRLLGCDTRTENEKHELVLNVRLLLAFYKPVRDYLSDFTPAAVIAALGRIQDGDAKTFRLDDETETQLLASQKQGDSINARIKELKRHPKLHSPHSRALDLTINYLAAFYCTHAVRPTKPGCRSFVRRSLECSKDVYVPVDYHSKPERLHARFRGMLNLIPN